MSTNEVDQQPICDAVTEVVECLLQAKEMGALAVLIGSLHVDRWSPEAMLCFLLISKREIERMLADGYLSPFWFVDNHCGTVERFAAHLRTIGRPDAEEILGLVRLSKT